MGSDTRLYVSSEWELNEIKQVIETRFDTKVKVKDCSKTSIGMFWFSFKTAKANRLMSIFTNTKTPIGNVTQLGLGTDEESIHIMTKIAKVLGGMLQENDCGDSSETRLQQFQGLFSEQNGISYFYKHAILSGDITNENDLVGLNESIHKWYKRVNPRGGNDMILFDEVKEE